MRDLKEVYKSATKELALAQLDNLKDKWSSKYGMVIDSWYNNWNNLSIVSPKLFHGLHSTVRKKIF